MEQETIAAIATPFGSGGIGIIRISGSKATAIAGALFRCAGTGPDESSYQAIDCFASHHLNHGYIIQGDHVVDEVLLVWMKAPHSYTVEDVIEIQSHSGAVVLNRILNLVLSHGARLAEPGEFTKRAYLNGRIDLSQAEAVADIICAKSETALQISTKQLTGAMRSAVGQFIERLNQLMAQIQAHLEFSEDMNEDLDNQHIKDELQQELIVPIKRLLTQYRNGHLLRDGVRLGIVGRPNVGKSSLLNYMLRKERAIVTHLPGTTRDLIEETFSIGGVPIVITDTAGLHATEDPVEKIGIQKTHENIEQSDLVLLVVDGTQALLSEDETIYLKIKSKKVILVINKMDLVAADRTLVLPEPLKHLPKVELSALTGKGVDALQTLVVEQAVGGVEVASDRGVIPNLRQKLALDLCLGALERAVDGLALGGSEDLVVEDLGSAQTALNQIIGQDVQVDVLDEIFSRFCIGK